MPKNNLIKSDAAWRRLQKKADKRKYPNRTVAKRALRAKTA